MTDRLIEICDAKRAHVAACRAARPLHELEARLPVEPARGFIRALSAEMNAGRAGLIAEIKRASPSRGVIRADFDPALLARSYEAGGAVCLSVLTDVPYFQGADKHLVAARAACALPVLRKEFMLDLYQVVEARMIGADAVLLIMAALDGGQASELEAAARGLGLDVLIEVHDESELERALRLRSPLIGINNRDLKTLRVDLSTTERLARQVPADRLVVCESGIGSPADIARMRSAGIHCFLVGESLLRQPDVTVAAASLLGRPTPARAALASEAAIA